MNKILGIFSLLLMVFAFNNAKAAPVDIVAINKTELNAIENYLNNIKSLDAEFVQESANGNVAHGKFFLIRPGKMRIEYTDPSKLLIIVNDSVLAYTDVELDETSYLRTNSTPASFLTRKNFSFTAKDVEVTDFSKDNNFIKVSLVKKNKKDAGVFSLIFQQSPLRFVKMEVKNDLGEVTKVSFTRSIFGGEISNQLFVIKNKNLPQ